MGSDLINDRLGRGLKAGLIGGIAMNVVNYDWAAINGQKSQAAIAAWLLLYKRKPPALQVVPKSFSYE